MYSIEQKRIKIKAGALFAPNKNRDDDLACGLAAAVFPLEREAAMYWLNRVEEATQPIRSRAERLYDLLVMLRPNGMMDVDAINRLTREEVFDWACRVEEEDWGMLKYLIHMLWRDDGLRFIERVEENLLG